MNKRSQIPLLKSLLKNRFESPPKPTSPFSLGSITRIPTQQIGSNSVHVRKPNSTQIDRDSAPFLCRHYFQHSYPLSHFRPSQQHTEERCYTTESGSELDYNREVDMINIKFAEAREEIELAMDSKETVYFDEEAECAKAAVKEVLDLFDGLLSKLKESQKEALQRSMGLKIEQLKAELKQLDD